MSSHLVDILSNVWTYLATKLYSAVILLDHSVVLQTWEHYKNEILELLRSFDYGRFFMYISSILFFVLAIFVLYWSTHSHDHRLPSACQKSIHHWQPFTTASQTYYCNCCTKLICGFWIFRNTGYQCEICGIISHRECLTKCNGHDCKTPGGVFPMKHQFMEGNLPSDSVCNICGIICSSSFSLQGTKCLWCGNTYHRECIASSKYDGSCQLGTLRNMVLPPYVIGVDSAEVNESIGRDMQEILKHPKENKNLPSEKGNLPSRLRNRFLLFYHRKKDSWRHNWKSLLHIHQKKASQNTSGSTAGNSSSSNSSSATASKELGGVASIKSRFTEQVRRKMKRHKRNESKKEEQNADNENDKKDENNMGSSGSSSKRTQVESLMKRNEIRNMVSVNSETAAIISKTCSPKIKKLWKISFAAYSLPSNVTPILVFVNRRSGGQQGSQLLKEFYSYLNPLQVVDMVNSKAIQESLMQFSNFFSLQKLKILVCGGDGTACWVMDEIVKVFGMNLDKRMIPIGVIPLGTGNDLARILGWGNSLQGNAFYYLQKLMTARSRMIDRWKVVATNKSTGVEIFNGLFNNYFDVGAAAHVSFKFHTIREKNPDVFNSQIGNLIKYGEVGIREFLLDKVQPLVNMTLFVDDEEVQVPDNLSGIIFINIPSFAGGVNLWNLNDTLTKKKLDEELYPPIPAASMNSMGVNINSADPLLNQSNNSMNSVLIGSNQGRETSIGEKDRGSIAGTQYQVIPYPVLGERLLGVDMDGDFNYSMRSPCVQGEAFHFEDLYEQENLTKCHSPSDLVDGHLRSVSEHPTADSQDSKGLSLEESYASTPGQDQPIQKDERCEDKENCPHGKKAKGKGTNQPSPLHKARNNIYLSESHKPAKKPLLVHTHQRKHSQFQPTKNSYNNSTCTDVHELHPATSLPVISYSPTILRERNESGRGPLNGGLHYCTSCRLQEQQMLTSDGNAKHMLSQIGDLSNVSRHLTPNRDDVASILSFPRISDPLRYASTLPRVRTAEDLSSSLHRNLHSFSHSDLSSKGSNRKKLWKKQDMGDGIIEVVGVRSLFHLGQIQVGLAEPIRLGQGRDIRLSISNKAPIQMDGEPREIPPGCELHITHYCEAMVLAAEKGGDGVAMRTAHEILDWALSNNCITVAQRTLLAREFSKKL